MKSINRFFICILMLSQVLGLAVRADLIGKFKIGTKTFKTSNLEPGITIAEVGSSVDSVFFGSSANDDLGLIAIHFPEGLSIDDILQNKIFRIQGLSSDFSPAGDTTILIREDILKENSKISIFENNNTSARGFLKVKKYPKKKDIYIGTINALVRKASYKEIDTSSSEIIAEKMVNVKVKAKVFFVKNFSTSQSNEILILREEELERIFRSVDDPLREVLFVKYQ